MNETQYKELVEKLGKEAADQIKAQKESIEKGLNEKFEQLSKGIITQKEFDEFKENIKNTELKSINEKLSEIKEAAIEQGKVIAQMKEGEGKPIKKSLKEFIQDNISKLKEFKEKGHGFIEITGTQLKAAGVTSVGNSITDMSSPPGSPYLPGLGGTELEVFDITRNPNFILNRVDVGSTNQFRLAWINETDYQGTPAEVAEGGAKPLTQHKFQVEISEAKKAAAYIELTEEFEDDVPGLATQVRRMLQNDVIRFFDDAIQTAVIAAARPYEITGLNGSVADANNWDALGAMLAQIAKNNYVANTVALNPVTMWGIWMQKDTQGRYLTPPFISVIDSKKVEATKVAEANALVGDMTQYKVDIYKDFVLKMGWINDNLINNKFCIVGEIRYHRYISDARKKAICYDALADVTAAITSGS
jgi:Phage capsid family